MDQRDALRRDHVTGSQPKENYGGLSRKDLLFMARVAEQAERFDDMV
jgi:hypothetical protein